MSWTYTPDNLFAGDSDVASEGATLVLGAGALTRGTILGKITLGAATVAAIVGDGGGALTLDATTPILAGASAGAYTVKCTTAASGGGTFTVFAPNGASLGTVAVGATFANHIKFAITDGTPDYSLGDIFTVTIAAGAGSLKKVAAASVDGSAAPYAILAEDTDATSAAKSVPVYLSGTFATDALVVGAGLTVAGLKAALRDINIIVKDTVTR